MSAEGIIDLTSAGEAAARAYYEKHVVGAERIPWEDLAPFARHSITRHILPILAACWADIARQAWDQGREAAAYSGSTPPSNPYAPKDEDSLDAELRKLLGGE